MLPLLPLQEGMYFHGAFGEGHDDYTDTYRVQQIAELVGTGRPGGVARQRERGRARGTRRCGRASASSRDGRIAQVIWADVPVDFEVVDATTRPRSAPRLEAVAARTTLATVRSRGATAGSLHPGVADAPRTTG